MHVFRHTAAFGAEQQGVARPEARLGEADRAGGGGEEDQPAFQPRLESIPARMTAHVGDLGIVHPGPLQRLVAPREAAGLDHVDRHAQAGGEPQEGADMSRCAVPRTAQPCPGGMATCSSGLVGLVEREPDRTLVRTPRDAGQAAVPPSP